ncbi:hypothetical protein PV10_02218 [Exophiala mesophila]|uniref:Uncharacterized protein n=1 Tax=Exophiala mesophila TaxID=212818 RepID=A0A0D1Y1P7_EXOME|nr:uncharacterized protein PV10_02218 [Exophiala mesophila]KIV94451.1 hypothetical protein PV10_02218 [Exophiala mesophila]
MANLPTALLVQVRVAFATCSRQHAVSRKSQFSTLRPLFRKAPEKPKTPKSVSIQVAHHRAQLQKEQEKEKERQATSSQRTHDTKELVPRSKEDTSVSTERKFQVPLKVIPKAQIAPNVSLSPRERLQLEELTRRTPRPAEPTVYKKKIRIYSAGYPRIYGVLFVKFTFTLILSVVTFVVVPAQWFGDVPVWVTAGFWLAWFLPACYVHWYLRGFVSEIFLRLPPKAQLTPKATMEYAKSLPNDSVLELTFMRWTMLPSTVSMKLGQLQPLSSRFQLANFGVAGPLDNPGTFLRPTPKVFYVRPRSAEGMAVKDTIPGIWPKVFARLTQKDSATRWQ